MSIKSATAISCFLLTSFLLSGCGIVGLAAGAGATVGIAAEREGGVSSAASDLRIRALISDKWFKYNLETFANLHLTVDEGRVLVTGIVQNPDARVEAVRLAWQVDGVTQVINEIRIADSESFPQHVSDRWITTRLRTELTFDGNVQSINYSIDTVDGTVYLMGIAANQAELDHVIDTARAIPRVKQVISYVKHVGEPVPSVAAPQATKYIPDGDHAGALAPGSAPPHAQALYAASDQGQASYARSDSQTPTGAPQPLNPAPPPDNGPGYAPPPPQMSAPQSYTPPPVSGSTSGDDMSGGAPGSFQPAPVEQQPLH